MEVDRNGLEILDRGECLRLLGSVTLGRIGLSLRAMPTVLPVSFRLSGDRILVRTGPGSRLDSATRDAVVAFEVDVLDPGDHTGWSVAVTGTAHETADPEEVVRAQQAPLSRLVLGGVGSVLSISTDVISGRRITSAAGHLPLQLGP